MKQTELRKHATCSLCKEPIGHTRLSLFWRVTIERFGIDLNAVRRQDGLASFLGHAGLAAAMGPDEDMAKAVMEPLTLTVCENCAVGADLPIAALAELEPTEQEMKR